MQGACHAERDRVRLKSEGTEYRFGRDGPEHCRAAGNPSSGVGHSHAAESEAAGREAVSMALAGHTPTADDLVILFTDPDYDVEALYRAACAEAAPAGVFGCTSTGGFTHSEQVPGGCVAALLAPTTRRSACAMSSATRTTSPAPRGTPPSRRATRAGDRHPNSVLLLLTDGLTRDQREIARGAYEVTTAVIPFVGGAAADNLTWNNTHTFGDGRVLSRAIVAVWINSERPMGVSVDHGWRPAGKPMLVTRAEGTVVHELDGTPALAAYLAEQGGSLERTDVEFFRKVMSNPVGLPECARTLRRPAAARVSSGGRRDQLQHRRLGAEHPPGDVDRRRRADRGRQARGRGRGPPARGQGTARPGLLVRIARPAARRPDPRRGRPRSRRHSTGSRSAASTRSASSRGRPAPAACTTRASPSSPSDDATGRRDGGRSRGRCAARGRDRGAARAARAHRAAHGTDAHAGDPAGAGDLGARQREGSGDDRRARRDRGRRALLRRHGAADPRLA